MKIELPDLSSVFRMIAGNRLLHTVVGVVAIYGCIRLVGAVGGTIFGVVGAEDATAHTGLRHISDMLVFGGVALVVVGVALYVMRFTVLQAIFLPFFDELLDMARKWRNGEKPTQAEASMALGWSIATGCTILGALIAIALVATPL